MLDISIARLPQSYDPSKTALAECQKIDECKAWADKSAALASYAKMAGDDTLEKMALRIRARAIRRCGNLLEQFEPANGANQNITDGTVSKVETRKSAASEAGLSERQHNSAIRVARVPEGQFEQAIEADKPATITELAEAGTQKNPPKNIVDLQGHDLRQRKTSSSVTPVCLFAVSTTTDKPNARPGACMELGCRFGNCPIEGNG